MGVARASGGWPIFTKASVLIHIYRHVSSWGVSVVRSFGVWCHTGEPKNFLGGVYKNTVGGVPNAGGWGSFERNSRPSRPLGLQTLRGGMGAGGVRVAAFLGNSALLGVA